MPTVATTNWSIPELQPYYEPDDATAIEVNLAASGTYRKGDAVGEVTATPGTFGLYNAGNAPAGTGTPKGLVSVACTTDGSGNITCGEFGVSLPTLKTIPIWVKGYFSTNDLPLAAGGNGALDAAGLAKIGHMVQGVVGVVNGVVRIS